MFIWIRIKVRSILFLKQMLNVSFNDDIVIYIALEIKKNIGLFLWDRLSFKNEFSEGGIFIFKKILAFC